MSAFNEFAASEERSAELRLRTLTKMLLEYEDRQEPLTRGDVSSLYQVAAMPLSHWPYKDAITRKPWIVRPRERADQPFALTVLKAATSLVVLFAPGYWLEYPALQWAGFWLLCLGVTGSAIKGFGQRMTIEQARKALDEIEAMQ